MVFRRRSQEQTRLAASPPRPTEPRLLLRVDDSEHSDCTELWFAEVPIGGATAPCWVYVTVGLEQCSHRQVVFILRLRGRESWEHPPQEPTRLLNTIRGLARDGRFVGPGSVTAGEEPFLEQRAMGVLYTTMTVSIPGLRLEPGALAAVLLRSGESRLLLDAPTLRNLIAYRIGARLCDATRFYPCPHWSDRDRPEVVAASPDGSLRAVGSAPVVSSGATLRCSLPAPFQVVLTIPRSDFEMVSNGFRELATALKSNEQAWVAFSLRADRSAAAQLTRFDPKDGIHLTAPFENLRMATDFTTGGLQILGTGDLPGLTLFEDVLEVGLDRSTFDRMVGSMTTRSPFLSEFPDGSSFSVQWAQPDPRYTTRPDGREVYESPFGEQLISDWSAHAPAGDRETPTDDRLRVLGAVMISGDREFMNAGVDAASLGLFVRSASAVFEPVLEELLGEGDGFIVGGVFVHAAGTEIRFSTNVALDDITQESCFKEIAHRLQPLGPGPQSTGPVMRLDLWYGVGEQTSKTMKPFAE